MAGDVAKRHFGDRKSVQPREDEELRYWSEKWKVSEDEVKRAIRKVGPMVKDVAHELGRT